MKTIVFLGNPDPKFTLPTWYVNAEELGFSARMNDISGLTKDDIIVIDKRTDIDVSSSPARVVLYYPDVVLTERHQSDYLHKRALALFLMAENADLVVCPPNDEVLSFVRQATDKPTMKMLFGAFTTNFKYTPRVFPKKKIERGFCWSLGSAHRDPLIREYNLTYVKGWGGELIRGLSRCRYVFNGHYTPILNNEQRLTEIPLSLSIPVSQPLSDPEQLKDLYIIPVASFHDTVLSQKEYLQIVRANVIAVHKKYNSRESLRNILTEIGAL